LLRRLSSYRHSSCELTRKRGHDKSYPCDCRRIRASVSTCMWIFPTAMSRRLCHETVDNMKWKWWTHADWCKKLAEPWSCTSLWGCQICEVVSKALFCGICVCVFLNVWEIILFLAYLHQNVFDIFLNIVFYLQRSIFVVNVVNKFYKKINIQFLGISS